MYVYVKFSYVGRFISLFHTTIVDLDYAFAFVFYVCFDPIIYLDCFFYDSGL